MTSVGLDDLRVVKGADLLTEYRFNTNTAQHYFCSNCGIYTHHRRRSIPNEYAVNLACIEGLKTEDFQEVPIFDGRDAHPSDK